MCKFPRAPPCPFCRAASAVSNLTGEACDRAAPGWMNPYHLRLAAYSCLDQGMLSPLLVTFGLGGSEDGSSGAFHLWFSSCVFDAVLWTTSAPSFVSTSEQTQLRNYEQIGGPTGMESASIDCWALEGWKRLMSALVCIPVPVLYQRK